MNLLSLLPRRTVLFRLAAGLALFAAAPLGAAPEADEGWTSLFNGKDLTGWKVPADNPFWAVKDGTLTGTNDEKKRGSMLYTEGEYGDFVLEAEAKWDGEIDSGFMFRKPELQLQIGISRSLKRDLTGSFYTGKYPESGQAKDIANQMKVGEWTKFRLEARGTTFKVWINDKEAVAGYSDEKYTGKGPIGLQLHPGVAMSIAFRNLRVKAL